MKGFSFVSIALAASSAIWSAYAAPVPLNPGLDVESRDDCTGLACARSVQGVHVTHLERRMNPAATAAIKWIQTSANVQKINSKPLIFYSGSTDIVKGSGTEKMPAWKSLSTFPHPGNDINAVLALAGQVGRGWSDADWRPTSLAFARAATGTVYVVLGKTVSRDSVWETVEKPALKANKAVTSVKVFQLNETGGFTPLKDLKNTAATTSPSTSSAPQKGNARVKKLRVCETCVIT